MRHVRLGSLTQRVETCNPAIKFEGTDFKYIDISSIDRETKEIREVQSVAAAEAPSRARQLVRTGDVLVSTVRPNLNGVAVVPPYLDGAVASTGFTVLRADPNGLDFRYLFNWVKTQTFVDAMVSRATGASYPAISDTIVRDSMIPLPSLDEQCRIAAILDKADSIRRKRQEAIKVLDRFSSSVYLEMFGNPLTNPRGWPERPLRELLARIDSGHSPVCLTEPAREDQWGVLKLGAVSKGRFLDFENKALPKGLEPNPELEVHSGDVLFSRKNTYDLVAACVWVHETRPNLMLPDLIFRLVPNKLSKIKPSYLWATLSNSDKRKTIQALAGGTSGSMPNISKAKLLDVLVPCPPIELQDQFEGIVRKSVVVSHRLGESALSVEKLVNALASSAFENLQFAHEDAIRIDESSYASSK